MNDTTTPTKSKTDVDKIRPLLGKGLSSSEIAKEANVSLQAVYRVRSYYKKKRALQRQALKQRAHAPDMINNPPHYTRGGIDVIAFIEAKRLNYNLGNVVKYVSRCELKGAPLADLKKAAWYLDREIQSRK